MISETENSNKFQKTRFWKEESVEDVITLGPTAQATLVSMMGLGHPYNSAPQFLQRGDTPVFCLALWALPMGH